MEAHLFDNTPAAPGEKHGPLGPTHCMTVTFDYTYQFEEVLMDTEKTSPHVVRITCPDLGREWVRGPSGKFTEIEGAAE